MAGQDKAAIAYSMLIVAVFLGVAASMSAVQDAGPVVSAPVVSAPVSTETSEPTKPFKAGFERATSNTDPGMGHESHQLAILLAPSDKVYSGTLKYDASEPIQLVTLHGPLADGEDKGQAIWTPDGETKFALTFVDSKNAKGEWKFAGNALAVHTMKTTPFIVDYKVDYTEKPMSDTVMTGTVMSATDPGIGHESHQLAVILAPSSDVYSGILSYSASENIQLVTLRGPVSADEKPAMMWTPDGETIFELTFVDPKNSMGSWEFSGNALAVHTMKTDQATISYSVSATATTDPLAVSNAQAAADKAAADKAAADKAAADKAAADKAAEPQTHMVDIPAGTGVPGCDETNECFSPADITINAGDTVKWTNVDTVAHTVTAGGPRDAQPDVFDSSLMMADASWSYTFDDTGSYDYFCMIHAWMTGTVTVN